jgi:hypothetical protein
MRSNIPRNRILVIALAGAAMVRAQSAPPASGAPPASDATMASLAGVVTNSVTGEPMTRVHVAMRVTVGGEMSITVGVEMKRYGAQTGAEGKFSIRQLPPGDYTLTAERAGFLMPADAAGVRSISLTLQAGVNKDDLKLALIPGGSITGRVLDEDGEPLTAVSVSAEIAGETWARATPDETGRYRMEQLRPAKYRIRVTPVNPQYPPEIRADGTKDFCYHSTYYPDAPTAQGALRLDVKPGAELSGIDVKLKRSPIGKVSGKVMGLPPGAQNVLISATRTGETSLQGLSISVILAGGNGFQTPLRAKADGSFTIWRLDPGKYTLTATCAAAGGVKMQSSPAEIEVGQGDIENVALIMVEATDVAGQLLYEDQRARPPQPAEAPPRVYLTPVGSLPYAARVDVSSEDVFTLPKVAPGRYRVFLSWPKVFTKSMRLGSVQIEGEILDVRNGAGGAPLTVLVSGANGNISGTVRDSKGPVAGAGVALTPDGDANRYAWFATAGADGTYKISDVPPGKYLLLATDDDYTGILQQGKDLGDYEGLVEHIEVHDGETTAKDLTRHPPGGEQQ